MSTPTILETAARPAESHDEVECFVPNHPIQYLTNEKGDRTAVILALDDYEQLLEDLSDAIVIAERRGEPGIPHEQFVAELKRDGIL